MPAKDELLPEYKFGYSKAKPNRFTGENGGERTVTVFGENLSRVFKIPESVKKALRAPLEALPPDAA